MKFYSAVLFAITTILSVTSSSTLCPCANKANQGLDPVGKVKTRTRRSVDEIDLLEEHLNKTLHYLNKDFEQIKIQLHLKLINKCKDDKLLQRYLPKTKNTSKMHKVQRDLTTVFVLFKDLANKMNQSNVGLTAEILEHFYRASCQAEALGDIKDGDQCRHVKKTWQKLNQNAARRKLGGKPNIADKKYLKCVALYQVRKVLEIIYTNVKLQKNKRSGKGKGKKARRNNKKKEN